MIQNKILISFIIPVYNGENHIKRCLLSIINQNYSNLEIIVINDGSTDNTEAEIKKINDKRIKQINISNSGVSNARNIGIQNSSGDYICFVDADDYIAEGMIEKLLYFLNDGIDIVRFNGFIEDEKGIFKKLEFPIKNNTIITSKSKKYIVDILNNPKKSIRCYSPLLIIKNSNIKPFNIKLKYLEDKLFYHENFLDNKKIMFFDECLYYYTYNPNSKTKSNKDIVETLNDLINSKEYIMNLFKNSDEFSDVIVTSYINLVLYRLDFFSKKLKYKDFKKLMKKVYQNDKLCRLLNAKTSTKLNILKKLQLYFFKKHYILFYYMSIKFKKIIR